MNSFLLKNMVGTILIAVGTIGGVTAASREPVHTALFTISVAFMILGIVVRKLRRSDLQVTAAPGTLLPDVSIPSLTRITADLHALRRELDGDHPPQPDAVGELFSSFSQNVSDLLSSVDGLHGAVSAGHIAQITSRISETERYLNRSWSATSDGYIEEARRSLEVASERFEEVLLLISEKTGGGDYYSP